MGRPEDLTQHIPVLRQEVLEGLGVRPSKHYLDATVGGGGHAAAILQASVPNGRLLGLDRDPEAAARAAERLKCFGQRAVVIHKSYINLADVAREQSFYPLDGVLFDLGFSSWQIDDPARGFSFRADGPLDMRFDPSEGGPTAADLVNQCTEPELVEILWQYGEEPHSRRIAQAILATRPIHSTVQLSEVILDAVPGARRRGIHPATLTFQALRIAVNQELMGLSDALSQSLAVLRPGGRLAVITFHSLEDRIVKHFMRQQAKDCICPPEIPVCMCEHKASLRLITRKPVLPSAAEVAANPRSRSAKLRLAEKIAPKEGM